jgi:hypothetical protein
MAATHHGKTATVALLLDRKANIEAKDKMVHLNTTPRFTLSPSNHFSPL